MPVMNSDSTSSVVFNLAELMQLEAERVSAEEAAARAAVRAAAQLRADAAAEAQRLRDAAARASVLAVQEAETQRELALLQARLAAEAQEREAARQHARALARRADAAAPVITPERGSGTRGLFGVLGVLGVATLAAALVYALWLRPALQHANDDVARAQQAGQQQLHELASLRQELAARHAAARVELPPNRDSVTPAPTPIARHDATPIATRPPLTHGRTLAQTHAQTTTHDSSSALTLDERNDDDPLTGLFDGPEDSNERALRHPRHARVSDKNAHRP